MKNFFRGTVRARLFYLVGMLLLVGQGCAVSFGGGGGHVDGGIFKSADRGENWVQRAAVPTVAPAVRTIGNVDVNSIVQDPSDPQALYVATNENGLIYSYDGGDSWMQVPKLSVGRINAIAVDPKNKCTIFIARANQVIKTDDCLRTFSVVYFDSRANVSMVKIVVNVRKNNEVLASTSAGDLLKSSDSGTSWTTIHVFSSVPLSIQYDPFAATNLYVSTRAHGVWKSADEGKTWQDKSAGLAEFGGANNAQMLVPDFTATDAFYLLSGYGILRTGDGGAKWEKINLLTPPGSTPIYSFAINPQNPREMYYATASTFYKTADGGNRWSTKKLPTSRAATALVVDYSNPNVLYMGGTQLKK